MDPQEFPTGKPSPRRELQGPRPAPLKVRNDSHRIKKQRDAPQPSQQPPQQRQPVIIYTVSPKVIHTNASEFMSLVQRLTGPSAASSSSTMASTSSSSDIHNSSSAISPSVRLATIQKSNASGGKRLVDGELGLMEGLEMGAAAERTSSFSGILSPVPNSLPPISPNFFSFPPTDPNSVSFLHDLSPMFHGNLFFPSPSTIFSASTTTYPTPPFDLFNNFLD